MQGITLIPPNAPSLYRYATKMCTTQNLRSTAHGPPMAAYLMRREPFLARLVFSSEKACVGLHSVAVLIRCSW